MSLFHLNNKTTEQIMTLINRAIDFKNGCSRDFDKKVTIATLFFEPSTRTHYSFHMAAKKLGVEVIDFTPTQSSLQKGESFVDTIKTFESFGTDLLVIRDAKTNYYEDLEMIKIPIINAGDGSGNHPTQALLDLMTIYEQFGRFEGVKIAICGDIAHSRVARTNYQIMQKLGMEVIFCAPEHFQADYGVYKQLDEVIENIDVCMLLRVQNERHETAAYIENYNELYGLNQVRLAKLKNDAIIMHPAPFNMDVELTQDVLADARCKIFEQSKNGVYMRMAVIEDELK